jgi:predicted enzyme related to lactoylglutathione lyase
MDVFSTPGAFSWSELLTTDPAAAKAFYSKLFGWGTKDMQMSSGAYTTCQVGEESVGGIMQIPAEAAGMPSMWGVYVTVADVDATIREAEKLGGAVLVQPMDVEGVGRMAVLRDPQGASFSVIKYANPAQ